MFKSEVEDIPEFLVVDCFCGIGGTTTGYEETNGLAKVIACINHDHNAITSHWSNYPDVVHFEEDIRSLELSPLLKVVNDNKKRYPNAKLILWLSLECTHFSKAKGKGPKKADSRTLAWDMIRYIETLNPDFIKIENVVEFKDWGPLNEEGYPIKEQKGIEYNKWCNYVCAMGYNQDWAKINSADHGAFTSRLRLFGCFYKPEFANLFPESTHCKKGINKPKWKAVKHVLELDLHGNSLFSKKRSEKTLERIYKGLTKFCRNPFISNYKSGDPVSKNHSLDKPLGSLTTIPTQALATPQFLDHYFGNGYVSSINDPASTLTTKDRISLVSGQFVNSDYSTATHKSIDEPIGAIVGNPKENLISPQFIQLDFSNGKQHDSIENPLGSITTVPKANLVTPWVMNTNYSNVGASVDEPCHTITANRKWHYLVNPQWFNKNPNSIEDPCFTLIARMDKAPPYLVTTERGDLAIKIFPEDTPWTIKIKEFMAENGIIDIKLRMLNVSELIKIQGFPSRYKISGTQAQIKKGIGNSVVPAIVKDWAFSLSKVNKNIQKVANVK